MMDDILQFEERETALFAIAGQALSDGHFSCFC